LQNEIRENPLNSTQEDRDVRAMNAEVINRLLTELHPESILDINSGDGSLAKQAAGLGIRVVCFEADYKKVAHLYSEAKIKGLSILPLIMDFTKPTPARGLGSHWAIAATERFQCDLVWALDFMNQPMSQRLGFDKIINGLSQFSKRWLVLELPLDPSSGRVQMKDNKLPDFTIDTCIQLLERQFHIVTKVDHPAKRSMLFVCEK
jgi:hypothetical protein